MSQCEGRCGIAVRADGVEAYPTDPEWQRQHTVERCRIARAYREAVERCFTRWEVRIQPMMSDLLSVQVCRVVNRQVISCGKVVPFATSRLGGTDKAGRMLAGALRLETGVQGHESDDDTVALLRSRNG